MTSLFAILVAPLMQPAHAFAPSDEVYIGTEPSRLMHFHPGQQTALRSAAPWQAFLDGDGADWLARFDQRSETPYRAWGPGIALGPIESGDQAAQALLEVFERNPGMVGVPTSALSLKSANLVKSSGIWYVEFDQLVEGVPVWRGGVTARISGDKLVMFGAQTHPALTQLPAQPELSADTAVEEAIAMGPAAEADHQLEEVTLVVLPRVAGSGLAYDLTWQVRTRTAEPVGIWVTHINAATGELLNVYNEVRFLEGSVTAEHLTRTLDGNYTTSPVPLAGLANEGGDFTYLDEDGTFELDVDGDFTTTLRGEYVRMNNDDGDNASGVFTGDTFDWANGDASEAEINSYIFLHHTQDWGMQFAPEVDMVTDRLTATVNIASSCNAYWDGSVNFFKAGDNCNNTGLIADVNYHEWGHGFHYYSLEAGQFDGSLSEGAGDVVSFLLTDDSVIAPYFMTSGSGIRDLAPDRVYPEDWVNEVHADGLIFGGAVWDLKNLLEDEFGDEVAFETTSALFAASLKGGPTVPQSYDEFFLADDDDRDLSNGTPNECLLLEAFGRHGLGPGGSNDTLLYVGHTPLGNQAAGSGDYPVTSELVNMSPGCFNVELVEAQVHYSIDGGSWQSAPLDVAGSDAAGAIPEQPSGSVVHYYVEGVTDDGQSSYAPSGATINPHSFVVGELKQLYCADFEDDDGDYTHELVSGAPDEGADDWQHGTPIGLGGDPDFAFSGDKIWGNDLGGGQYNGEYQNDKFNRLSSPEIDVSEASGPLVLQFQRWLSVEDGVYDEARVVVDDETVWSNHTTNQNIGNEHHQDRAWGLHTLTIEDGDGDGFVNLSWELESDRGLTFGGWNIDDVCVYSLELGEGTEDSGIDGGIDGGPDDGGLKAGGCACSSTSPANGAPAGLAAALLAGLVLRRRRS